MGGDEYLTGFFGLLDLGVTFCWTPCLAGRFSTWNLDLRGRGGCGGGLSIALHFTLTDFSHSLIHFVHTLLGPIITLAGLVGGGRLLKCSLWSGEGGTLFGPLVVRNPPPWRKVGWGNSFI